jgi:AraC family transcriptional regulator
VWQRLMRWAQARELWTAERRCIGISQDDPRVTEPSKCRYDAGIVVPEALTLDEQVNVLQLPPTKVAAATFVGPASEVGTAWDRLFREWLPQSGFQPDDGPCMELYGHDAYDPVTNVFRCELCVPVRPL